MLDWLQDHPVATSFIAGVSVLFFVIGLLAMPFIVGRVPADYFSHGQRPPGRLDRYPIAARLTLRVGKNLLGVVLVLAGLAMLVLPGQGLLTILVGFLLLDLPGKYRMEKWLVGRRWVHRPVNWLRERRGREPLSLSSETSETN